MFTPLDRARVHDRLLEWARHDARVVAGAVVGSLADRPGDRFSDVDLTFGLRDGVAVNDVLEDWSRRLSDEFEAVHLFDVSTGAATYRVFLLPGCLQVDLSFAPASEFGAIGPHFRLLFGTAVQKPFARAPNLSELFGYGVHHAVRSRVCIERHRLWQAEYWISAVRDHALTMACVRLAVPAHHGRGFDDLPDDIRHRAAGALVPSLDEDRLLNSLRQGTELLLGGISLIRLSADACRSSPRLRRDEVGYDRSSVADQHPCSLKLSTHTGRST